MEQFVTNKNRSFLLYGRGMPRPDCPIRFGNRRRESVVVTIVGDYQRIAPPIGESRLEYDFPGTLRRLVEEMKEIGEIGEMSELVTTRVGELIPVERIGFFLVGEGTQRMQLLAHRGFGLLEKHGVRLQRENLKTGLRLPVALDDSIEPGQRYEPADQEVFLRWGIALVIPMMSGADEIIGFLALGPKEPSSRFTAEDVDLLTTVSLHAGLSIQRITLQEKLSRERESGDRLRELNQLKSDFLSSVSHDLKTPLTSIRLFAELLRTKKNLPASRVEEYLKMIEGESERLTRLINSVLDFARVERGVKDYHFSEVSIDELVGHVLETMEYQLAIGRFTVVKRFHAGNRVLSADPDAVTEALINLIGNAIKYSPGRRELEVSTFRHDGSVAVRVRDHGAGIPPDEFSNIFEPFYQTEGAREIGAGGAGLGLALVKHIVEAHRGHIEVKSTPGEGSEFTLFFPEKQPAEGGGAGT